MDETARAILNRLRQTQFADLEGAEAAVVLPISDRLLTELIRYAVPAVTQLREFAVRASSDNILTISLRLAQPAFLPAFNIRLHIEAQPQLPSSPILQLRVLSRGLAALAGPITAFLDALPPGVSLEGDRLSINLITALERYGAAEVLSHLSIGQLTTSEGRVVITLRGAFQTGPGFSER